MVASLDVVVADSHGLVDLVRCLEDGEPRVVVQLRPAGDPQVARRLAAYHDRPGHVLAQLRREMLDLLDDHGGVAGTRCCFACLQGDVPSVLDLQIVE